MKRIVEKMILVEVEGVLLYLKLDKECVMNIMAKKMQGSKFNDVWVEEEDATQWIEKYVCYNISKK